MTDLVVDALGLAVGLTVPPGLAAALHSDLGDLPTASTADRHLVLAPAPGGADTDPALHELALHDGAELVLDHIDPAIGIAAVVWRLNTIVAASPDHVVLHAGCVAGPAGGLVLPGPSGTGKTHLTAALVEAGFGYLSDEHAAVSKRDGLLAPFPKPLDLGAAALTRATAVRAGCLAGRSAPRATVLPRYVEGGSTALVPLPAADALLALCGQSPSLGTAGERAFLLLATLALRPVAACTYGDSAEAVAAIEGWLLDLPAGAPLTPVDPLAPVTATTTTVMVDDELVVLDRATGAVHRLNRSAGLVWLCAPGAPSRRDVVALALEECPPGALVPADVEATVDHLCDLGLLSFEARAGAPRSP